MFAVSTPSLPSSNNQSPEPLSEPLPKCTLLNVDDFPSLGVPVACAGVRPSVAIVASSATNPKVKPNLGNVLRMAAIPTKGIKSELTVSEVVHVDLQNISGRTDPVVLAKSIGKKHTAATECSTSKSAGILTVIFTGLESAVARCKKDFELHYCQMVESYIEVPKGVIGFLIGTKGQKIHEIETKSGCKVKIPKSNLADVSSPTAATPVVIDKSNDEDVFKVVLLGTQSAILSASDMIKAIVAEHPVEITEQLVLNPLHAHVVFGTKFADKEAIATRFNVRLFFGTDDAHRLTLKVVGVSEKIAEFKAFFAHSTDAFKSAEGMRSIGLPAPEPLLSHVFGAESRLLLNLWRNYACFFDVLPAAPCDLQVYGRSDDLLKVLNILMELISSFSHVELRISPLERHFVRVFDATLFERIEEEFLVDVALNSPKAASNILLLNGAKKRCDAAAAAIAKVLASAAAKPVKAIPIEADLVKHVIGKKSQTKTKLEADFGVTVAVCDDCCSPNNAHIFLFGDDATKIDACADFILQKIVQNAKMTSRNIEVASKHTQLLFGVRFSQLKALIDEYSGMHVAFPPKSRDKEASIPCCIRLRGLPEEVQAFEKAFGRIIEEIKHEIFMSNYTVEVPLEDSLFATLNSDAAGSRIVAKLRREFDVVIALGEDSLRRPIATIRGLKSNADACKQRLVDDARNLRDTISDTFDIEARFAGIVVGKAGANLKKLEARHGVRTHVAKEATPAAESDTKEAVVSVALKGVASRVAAAKKELLELVAYERTLHHTHSLPIDAQHMKVVMGRAGATIQGIAATHAVRIRVASRTESHATLIIEGAAACVEAATAAIRAVISAAKRTLTLPVCEGDSRCLSPFRALFFAHIRRLLPAVTHLALNSDSLVVEFDPTLLPVSDVDAAVKLIEAPIENLMHRVKTYVRRTVALDSAHHRFVVGRNGEHIKQLRDAFNVAVELRDGGGAAVCGEPAAVDAFIAALLDKTVVTAICAPSRRLTPAEVQSLRASLQPLRSRFGCSQLFVDAATHAVRIACPLRFAADAQAAVNSLLAPFASMADGETAATNC